MKNLSKLEYPDMYQHWYQGYTKIFLPSFFDGYMVWDGVIMEKQLLYYIYTSAPSGNISTQYFAGLFDPEKLERGIIIGLMIFPDLMYFSPAEQMDGDKTIMFDLDRISMETEPEFETFAYQSNSSKTSLKWLTVTIFLKWQVCSMEIWLDVAVILEIDTRQGGGVWDR